MRGEDLVEELPSQNKRSRTDSALSSEMARCEIIAVAVGHSRSSVTASYKADHHHGNKPLRAPSAPSSNGIAAHAHSMGNELDSRTRVYIS